MLRRWMVERIFCCFGRDPRLARSFDNLDFRIPARWGPDFPARAQHGGFSGEGSRYGSVTGAPT